MIAALHLLLGMVAACGLARPAAAWQATVLDLAELPPTWQTHELSGLAWLPAEQALMAVSDRGLLWRLPLQWEKTAGTGRLHLGAVPDSVTLPRPVSGKTMNAEALTRCSEGALMVADERSHLVQEIGLDGSPRGTRPVPGPADMGRQLRDGNAGIEALACHPAHGLMAVAQRPLRGADSGVHRLHAADGRHWDFRAAAGGPSAVKAIEVLDASTVLVLERASGGKSSAAVLRPLILGDCTAATPCDPPALPLRHPQLQGRDNIEGLTCPTPDRCLLISDDGGRAKGRTLLVLVVLSR